MFLGYIKLVVYCRIYSSSGNIKHARNHIGHYPAKEADLTVNQMASVTSGFDSLMTEYTPVAQLDRARVYEARCREFESP